MKPKEMKKKISQYKKRGGKKRNIEKMKQITK